VFAEAATGREATMQAQKHRPDIRAMDISIPELNGLEAIRKICKLVPTIGIAVFSLHHSNQLVRDAVEAGVRVYVLKSDACCLRWKPSSMADHSLRRALLETIVNGAFNESILVRCRCLVCNATQTTNSSQWTARCGSGLSSTVCGTCFAILQ
jgi:chemotaxis response regulator CheB